MPRKNKPDKDKPQKITAGKAAIGLGVSVLMGLTVFLIRHSWGYVNPFHVDWLLHLRFGDAVSEFVVWRFFKYEKWLFPLGKITGYLYPYGTSIGFGDCIPVMGLTSKLFVPFVGAEFQYFGLWLFSCFLMQGFFAYLLMSTITGRQSLRLIGTAFFSLSPIFLARDHYALHAQWLLLASLWIYFGDFENKHVFRAMAGQIILAVSAVMIHPYMAGMVSGMVVAYGARLFMYDRKINLGQFAGFIAVFAVLVGAAAYALGFISSGKQAGGWGFGYYSMNLNALFNPQGPENAEHTSLLFKNLPEGPGQYEGYNYLGLGFAMLTAYVLLFTRRKKSKLSAEGVQYLPLRKKTGPLVILSILYTIFALSNTVKWGNTVVLSYDPGDFLLSLASLFRCSGRFFWVPYYLILFLVLRALFHRVRSFKKIMVIAVSLLCVQVVDIYPLITNRDKTCRWITLDENTWLRALRGVKTLVVFPPFTKDIRTADDYINFLYFAATDGVKINAGYMLRPISIDRGYINKIVQELTSGNPDPDSAYLLTDEFAHRLGAALNADRVVPVFVHRADYAQILQLPVRQLRTDHHLHAAGRVHVFVKYVYEHLLVLIKLEE